MTRTRRPPSGAPAEPIRFPVEGLTDGTIRLRLMAEGDVDAVVEACQDAAIQRWTTVPSPYGSGDARAWLAQASHGIAAGTDLPTLICAAGDQRPLGSVGLHRIHPELGRAEAGYWVAAPERGRGLAARGLALLCAFAFDELALARVEMAVEPRNAASRRVAQRAGFTSEGLLRSYMPVGGARRDMLMYSLLRDDPRLQPVVAG